MSGWSLAGEAWPRPYGRPNVEPIALAGEAWPRPYRHPAWSQLRWRARHGLAPTGTQRGAYCAGGRGMASPLQAPSVEPQDHAWPTPSSATTASTMCRRRPRPSRGRLPHTPTRHTTGALRWRARHGLAPTGDPAWSLLRWRARHGLAPTGDPARSQLRRGEAMPRPPASNRGCPDPVSKVMNQHRS